MDVILLACLIPYLGGALLSLRLFWVIHSDMLPITLLDWVLLCILCLIWPLWLNAAMEQYFYKRNKS